MSARVLTLHMEPGGGTALPLPYHIDAETGDCVRGAGTPDVTGDRGPWRLLGFQAGMTQRVVLTRHDFVTAPDDAVGLVPVWVDAEGQMFHTVMPVGRVTDMTIDRVTA